MHFIYSRWHGGQGETNLDAEAVLDALSDDLIADGDLENALQRIARWGVEKDGRRMPGVQQLLQQVRAQRQQALARYSLDGMLERLRQQLNDVVRAERAGIERRRAAVEAVPPDLRDLQRAMLDRQERMLNELPDDLAAGVAALAEHELLDDAARAGFDELLHALQQQVLQQHVQNMQQSLRDMTPDDIRDLADTMRDLADMLNAVADGAEPDFERFMLQHGQHFPDARSLHDVIAHLQEQSAYTESLLASMSSDARAALEAALGAVLRHEGLREQMARVTEAMMLIAPPHRPRRYPFEGDESLTLREALDVMRCLHDLDSLERDFKDALERGDLDDLDGDTVRRLLGDEAGQAVEQLQEIPGLLKAAGYVGPEGNDLTARGVRRLGEKALRDIFAGLARDAFGTHQIPRAGTGPDPGEATREYRFGEPFTLDLGKTVMNAVTRQGQGTPLRLSLNDFAVYETEQTVRSSTVLLLDLSRSMPLRGCFVAAKKVAFALHSLIRTQFPRDDLYIVGFADFARELQPESLHHLTWGDYVYGTNMQHGLMVARRLLGRHRGGNKQVILITDGEPTAHVEQDRIHFSYPPTFRTLEETLREVQRCTREGIVINTFMLERSHYLTDFVNQLTRINHGRAFFATPDRLGDYVVVDYVRQKMRGR